MPKIVMKETAGGYEVPVYPECPNAEDGHAEELVFCKLYPKKTKYHSCVANQMGHELCKEDPVPCCCPFGK